MSGAPSEQSAAAANIAGPPISARLSLGTIVETSIYASDLDAMEQFYTRVMNLSLQGKEAGRHLFFTVGPGSMLLIFNPETTRHGHHLPSHGSTGAGHLAFGVAADLLDDWRKRLTEVGVGIETEITWPRGGHSIYFRDPAGNSVELITPGVWGTPAGW